MSPRELKESPSQTAGPYVHIGCTPNWLGIDGVWDADLGQVMVTPETEGERILVKGRVIDGSGVAVKDAVVEIWQADAKGRYNADPRFTGWGRQPTDGETGEFRFETIKPGRVAGPDGRLMAPHLTVWIVARGINVGLHTRMYFGDEGEANAADPVLARVYDPKRRQTLVAPRIDERDQIVYRFDIRLQGEGETVFFDM